MDFIISFFANILYQNVKLQKLLFVVRRVWISPLFDDVLLSAVDSSLLTVSVTLNLLLKHESDANNLH